jgi:hypothetical protein
VLVPQIGMQTEHASLKLTRNGVAAIWITMLALKLMKMLKMLAIRNSL